MLKLKTSLTSALKLKLQSITAICREFVVQQNQRQIAVIELAPKLLIGGQG